MEKIEVKDAPANVSTYKLDDGRYLRVALRLLTPDERLADAADIEVETTAYEVNKAGDFMVDQHEEPIMLPKQRARIPMGNVRSGTDSVKPGWRRVDADFDPKNPGDVKVLKTAPRGGKGGDRYYSESDKAMYEYTEGLYEQLRRSRVAEFEGSYPVQQEQTPLNKQQIADLRP